MKKSVKIALIVAACLVGAGILLVAAAAVSPDFDFRRISPLRGEVETYTYENPNDFESIVIDVVESDVRVLRSSKGELQIICDESDRIYHEVRVENGTLYVTRNDTRRWFERIFSFDFREMTVTVYLPQELYAGIHAKSVSGDVIVEAGVIFDSAELKSTSGELSFYAATEGALSLTSVSGDVDVHGSDVGTLSASSTSGSIEISRVRANEGVEVDTTSGDIGISHVTAVSLSADSTSGDARLENTVVTEHLKIETTSGDIELEACDAATLSIDSMSGEVEGTLLSGKMYSTETDSGSVRVPASTSGAGECRISTNSGDIYITET